MKLRLNKRKSLRLLRGTSLVEVLLTLVLVLALIGTAVSSFNGTHAAAALREGAERFESLVQFARAEASLNGKKYRLVFTESTNEISGPALKLATLEVESNPVTEPGVFTKVKSAPVSNADLNSLVGVEAVKLPGAPKKSAAELAPAGGEMDGLAFDGVSPDDELGSIIFYPDGSSDSVELILAPRDSEQKSRIALRISGVTGTISRQFMDSEAAADAARDEDEFWDETAGGDEYSASASDQPASYPSSDLVAAQP